MVPLGRLDTGSHLTDLDIYVSTSQSCVEPTCNLEHSPTPTFQRCQSAEIWKHFFCNFLFVRQKFYIIYMKLLQLAKKKSAWKVLFE